MDHDGLARIAALERRQRLLVAAIVLMLGVLGVTNVVRPQMVQAQQKAEPRKITASELVIVDDTGKVRIRLGGDLPDAVINGKPRPRGQRAAGVLLYDATGTERSGYVTFEPSGNVALTLDAREKQVATFVAGPDGTSALQLFSGGSSVEMRNDDDGPSIHATSRKQVRFHEPPVENPERTEMCKALREAKAHMSLPQLFEACRTRTSEAACQACLAK